MRTVARDGHHIFLLVADNSVTRMAVDFTLGLIKPGRDMIHFVTAVVDKSGVEKVQKMIEKFEEQVMHTLVATKVGAHEMMQQFQLRTPRFGRCNLWNGM